MTKKTIKEWVLEKVKDETLNIKEVVKYGCVNGSVSSLIYYSDTVKFYDEFEGEIWDMLHEENENFGSNNILETIGKFNGAKNVFSLKQFKNLLAWYAVEETCRKLLDEQEKDVA